MFQQKWLKITAMAVSLPSTILTLGFLLNGLYKNGYISKGFGFIVFLLIVGNTLYLMVWYAFRKKN